MLGVAASNRPRRTLLMGIADHQKHVCALFASANRLTERPQPRHNAIAVRYDGSTDSMALVDRLLGQQTPHLTVSKQGTNGILAKSFPAIDDKFRLTRGLQLAFGRCISLIERALQSQRERPVSPAASPVTPQGLPAFVGRFVTRKTRLASAPVPILEGHQDGQDPVSARMNLGARF